MSRKIWTLGTYWPEFAVRRRLHVRDWQGDESRFELYVAPDPIAKLTFAKLGRRDVKAWLARMLSRRLKPQTTKNALAILRAVCADAVDAELMKHNPCSGIKLSRSSKASTHEGWTILDPDEQIALLRAVATEEQHMVAFALHTGMRNSEIWSLRTKDIDLESGLVTVRYSKRDLPPKGGKIRRVPLFGMGLDAAIWAVKQRREFAWPSPRTGERRYPSSQPSRWNRWVDLAGIERHVRFYDLRHTTATSLLAGWWGRKWSIDEVRQMLGHSSVKVTERYAHLIDDTLWRAGRATAGLGTNARTETGASFEIRTRDLRFTNPHGYEGFSRVARKVLLEKYEGPHERLALEILRGLDDALARVDARPRLAKAERLLDEARHAG